ncbi:MAG: hypothetical protein K9H48_16500 [Melioribacteraceae bacterium]|nr:hypothetical protein [Melioribacteraceae bacterium]MCF8395512.1 hypothetical protein [Melioribacteraceae bacterium]
MKPDEIQTIIETAIKNEIKYFWVYIILSVVIGIAGTYIFEYFKQKGKNLATKSDIKVLTEKVEDVKSEYVKQIEKFKGTQKIIDQNKEDLYKRVVELNGLLLKAGSDPQFNMYEKLFETTRNILFIINSNYIFDNIKNEAISIEADYNSWLQSIEDAKRSNSIKFTFSTKRTQKSLKNIQEVILK